MVGNRKNSLTVASVKQLRNKYHIHSVRDFLKSKGQMELSEVTEKGEKRERLREEEREDDAYGIRRPFAQHVVPFLLRTLVGIRPLPP